MVPKRCWPDVQDAQRHQEVTHAVSADFHLYPQAAFVVRLA
jgi:hypothetical protein